MRVSFLTKKSDSFAASLDVRLKLILCAGSSLPVIFLSAPEALGIMLAGATLLAATAASVRILVIVCLAATFMMGMTVSFSWLLSLLIPNGFTWTLSSLAVPYLRMLVTVMLVLTLALSSPVQLVVAKLHSLRLPGFLIIPISVALRFIPTFIDDCSQIRDAVRLRPGKGLLSYWRGAVVPLVFRVLSSAEDLAMAAELKGLAPDRTMTTPPQEPFSKRDLYVLALALMVLTAAIAVQSIVGPSGNLRGH